jgi:hypothetical protein
VAQTGVYYGYAQVFPLEDGSPTLSGDDILVQPMVMSLGWNPFYKNERLSAVRSSQKLNSLQLIFFLPKGNSYYA